MGEKRKEKRMAITGCSNYADYLHIFNSVPICILRAYDCFFPNDLIPCNRIVRMFRKSLSSSK